MLRFNNEKMSWRYVIESSLRDETAHWCMCEIVFFKIAQRWSEVCLSLRFECISTMIVLSERISCNSIERFARRARCAMRALVFDALRIELLVRMTEILSSAFVPRFSRHLRSFKHESVATILLSVAIALKTMLVLDNLIIKDELKLVKETSSTISFDTSHEFAIDDEYVIDFNLDQWMKNQLETKTMREVCVFENLIEVQSVFKIHWLDRSINERIDKDELEVNDLRETIRRNNVTIARYLLLNVISMQSMYFALIAEYHAYSILQLYMNRKWNINTYLSRMQSSALS